MYSIKFLYRVLSSLGCSPMNESVRKRTKFLKVVPYIYRHYQVLPDGSKGEGVGAYYLYLWHKGEQIKESLCDDLVEAKLKTG